MLVLFLVILATIIVGCSVPFYQYCKEKYKSNKKQRVYFFDESLFNYDTDNLRFENVTYSTDTFEVEKAKVYEIELP